VPTTPNIRKKQLSAGKIIYSLTIGTSFLRGDLLSDARKLDEVTSFVAGYLRSKIFQDELRKRSSGYMIDKQLQAVHIDIDGGKVLLVADLSPMM
jgi:hypothetical protein